MDISGESITEIYRQLGNELVEKINSMITKKSLDHFDYRTLERQQKRDA